MLENFKSAIIPNIIGIGLIMGGWFFTLVNARIYGIGPVDLITKGTLFGLILILLGAYLPRIWSAIANRGK